VVHLNNSRTGTITKNIHVFHVFVAIRFSLFMKSHEITHCGGCRVRVNYSLSTLYFFSGRSHPNSDIVSLILVDEFVGSLLNSAMCSGMWSIKVKLNLSAFLLNNV
jgi:hypothetical protein